jgi:two-component system, response regulator
MNEILLIEDNEDDREAVVRAFQTCGCDILIHWFKDSMQVLKYLQDNNPQLILLDLNMPGLNGKMLLKEIKANDHLKKIPIVVLSTSIDPKDVLDCYSYGANSYIQKPANFFHMKDICQSLSAYWFKTSVLPTSVKQ